MKIIGLCGGSGSGKGSVCSIFAKLGVPSVDTDAVYHSLVSSDSPCLKELKESFGEEITVDGKLDRAKLASIVFSNEKRRLMLNSIAHKHVLNATRDILLSFERKGYSYSIVDAPLLFESGFDKECDYTVAVLADKELRIKRIVNRDGIMREGAIKRINSQMSDEELISRCDYYVYNNGCMDDLAREVEKIFKKIN